MKVYVFTLTIATFVRYITDNYIDLKALLATQLSSGITRIKRVTII